MRMPTLIAFVLVAGAATPALPMTHMMAAAGSGVRIAAADPGEHLERLAAAATRGDRSNAKPVKSIRSILKDDPFLRAAFASLDNR